MARIISLIFTILALALPAFAADLTGEVIHVQDGDTITVRLAESGVHEKVRIIGVDTPELRGKCGEKEKAIAARDYVSGLVLGKTVTLRLDDANKTLGHRDKYWRLLAHVVLSDGSQLAEKLIAGGYGEPYLLYGFDPELQKRYLEAR